MTFSIITPSFGQLDWLRLCIASVADQAVSGEGGAQGAESRDRRTEVRGRRAEVRGRRAEGAGLQIDDCSLLIPENSAGQRQGAEGGIESPANAGWTISLLGAIPSACMSAMSLAAKISGVAPAVPQDWLLP